MGKSLVAYYRVSTDRQGIRGLGIEAQQSAAEQFARQSGGDLVAEYREAESGKRSDRPQLRDALRHTRRIGGLLVVAKLDRLGRNMAFLSALMDAGVDFVCCDNPTANRLTLHILAAVAEDEARRISQRTKEALAVYKRRGGVLGTHDPRCALNRTPRGKAGQRKSAELSRQRAASADALVLSRIQELRSGGESFRAIAAALNDAGQTTRTGCHWSARQVQRVLDRAERDRQRKPTSAACTRS